MMKRGPKVPTKVLEQRGSWRIKTRRGEPQPDIGLPEIPSIVDNAQTRVWFNEIATDLLNSGLVTKIDGLSLALLVDAIERFVILRKSLRKGKEYDPKKLVVESIHGSVKPNPHVANLHVAWDQVKKLALEFGMSPVARTSIKTGSGSKTGKESCPVTFEDRFVKKA